jgi:hypothetical protein
MYRSNLLKKRSEEAKRRSKKHSCILLYRLLYLLEKANPSNSQGSETKTQATQWLRISMLYHHFSNMRDIFQSQLSAKMIENAESLDFNTRECNCRSPSGNCQYGKVCRVPIVVYKVKCKTSGKIYIGNTQHYFKNRMRGHFQDVKQLVENNVYSDSYAQKFGGQVPKGVSAPTPGMQRDLISCSIIWKGAPLTAVKSYGRTHAKSVIVNE